MNQPLEAGDLDPDFGDGGVVQLHIDGIGQGTSYVLSNGKILSVSVHGSNTATVIRHLPDGNLDKTFGEDGIVQTQLGMVGNFSGGMQAVLEGDKILIGGEVETSQEVYLCYVRLTPDGQLDGSFGVGGRAAINLPNTRSDQASDTAVQADGKIVALANSIWGFDAWDTVLLRLTTNGALDTTFGHGGFSYAFPPRTSQWKMQVLPDGKLLTNGMRGEQGMISRYEQDGRPDPGFGQDGHFYLDVTQRPGFTQIDGTAVDADGKILVVGNAGRSRQTAFIARVEADGSGLDSTFNNGEPMLLDLGDSGNIETFVIPLADGKILSLGHTFGTSSTATLRRFLGDGTPDTTFGQAGLVVTNPGEGVFHQLTRLQVQADGKYVAAGSILDTSIGWSAAIFRFLP